MILLIDTSVWSLAFRRDVAADTVEVSALSHALSEGTHLVTTGLIVQELLQGFHGPRQQRQLIERLSAIPSVPPETADHISAAEIRNRCRRRGVQLGTIDALLVALCVRYELTLLSADGDFANASAVVRFQRWAP